MEIWKPIIIEKQDVTYDYTGLYEVSNLGKVRSLDRIDAKGNRRKGKILKPRKNNKGYLYVALSKNGKVTKFLVHRLVATMFIPNPDNLQVVNHRDENPSNCHVDNLEWATQQYNMQYSSHKISKSLKGRTFTDEWKQKISDKHADFTGDKNPKARKVVCLETGQIFTTIKEAEQWCGKKGVGNCCRGKTKKCGGYHWMYLDDYLTESK